MHEKSQVEILFEAIFRLRLTDQRRMVLLAMAGDADPISGHMQLAIGRLAWKLEKSESQARRYLQDVVAAGLLTVVCESRGRIPSVYALCPSAAQPKPMSRYSERVDYTQPSNFKHNHDRVAVNSTYQNAAHTDRVSVNPPKVAEPMQRLHDVAQNGGLGATLQNLAHDDRVNPITPEYSHDRVAPPNNPPRKDSIARNTKKRKAKARDQLKADVEAHRPLILELMKVDGYDTGMIYPENLSWSEQEKYRDLALELTDIHLTAADIAPLHRHVTRIANQERWSVKVRATTLPKYSGKYLQSKLRLAAPVVNPIATPTVKAEANEEQVKAAREAIRQARAIMRGEN